MISRVLAEVWADARTASPERRVLVVITIGAALVTGAAAGVSHPLLVVGLATFSVLAAIQPASNTGLVVMVIIGAAWVATSEETSGPTSIAIAAGLVVFHLCVALMAATPHSSTLGPRILRRWAIRGVVAGSSAVAVWLLVQLLDRRHAEGSTLLTAASLLFVTGAAIAAHTWSIRSGESEPTDTEPRAHESERSSPSW